MVIAALPPVKEDLKEKKMTTRTPNLPKKTLSQTENLPEKQLMHNSQLPEKKLTHEENLPEKKIDYIPYQEASPDTKKKYERQDFNFTSWAETGNPPVDLFLKMLEDVGADPLLTWLANRAGATATVLDNMKANPDKMHQKRVETAMNMANDLGITNFPYNPSLSPEANEQLFNLKIGEKLENPEEFEKIIQAIKTPTVNINGETVSTQNSGDKQKKLFKTLHKMNDLHFYNKKQPLNDILSERKDFKDNALSRKKSLKKDLLNKMRKEESKDQSWYKKLPPFRSKIPSEKYCGAVINKLLETGYNFNQLRDLLKTDPKFKAEIFKDEKGEMNQVTETAYQTVMTDMNQPDTVIGGLYKTSAEIKEGTDSFNNTENILKNMDQQYGSNKERIDTELDMLKGKKTSKHNGTKSRERIKNNMIHYLRLFLFSIFWTFLCVMGLRFAMISFWSFDPLNTQHWTHLQTAWQTGQVISAPFISILFASPFIWFIGLSFVFKFKKPLSNQTKIFLCPASKTRTSACIQ